MNKKKLKILSIVLIFLFVINSIVAAKMLSGDEHNKDNVAPNATLSASVVHPKKVDIVLATDYQGTQKSNLITAANNTINDLFAENTDARLYVQDNNNKLRVDDLTYDSFFSSPIKTSYYDEMPSTGNTYAGYVDIEPNTRPVYKRKLKGAFGNLIWNSNDTLTFVWDDKVGADNVRGQAPIPTKANAGIVQLEDAPTNIAKIGVTKYAILVLTTDGKLYMSGKANYMASQYWNMFYNTPAAYTGLQKVYDNVKDLQTNMNGAAIVMQNGKVYYSGNNGVQMQYAESYPVYSSVMNVSSGTDNQYSYSYLVNPYVVTNGFQEIPGMSNITRIFLGNISIIALDDNTGDCYGIGFNQGQFGWGNPYFRQCTVDNWSKTWTLPIERNVKKIPLLDARKIKELYMYGFYSKVIHKDRTIWKLGGGGFTKQATPSGMYTGVFFSEVSNDPGTYEQIGTLEEDEVTNVDIEYGINITYTKIDNQLYDGGYYVNAYYMKQTYSTYATRSVSIKKDGTAVVRQLSYGSVIEYRNYFFSGIHPVYAVNTTNIMSTNYRANSDKIFLYVSDNTGKNYKTNEFGGYFPGLSLTNTFAAYLAANNYSSYAVTPSEILNYVEPIVGNQDISLDKVVNSTNGKTYTQGNYAAALNDIKNKYKQTKEDLNQYVIVDEDVLQYTTQMLDRENDAKNSERWRYKHNASIFENSLGEIENNNVFVSSPINKFSKPGEYKITYQAQDKPTNENTFLNYNKWSNNEDQLRLIAHRRPIAKFTAAAPKLITTHVKKVTNFDDKNEINVTTSNCSLKNNGTGGSKAIYGAATYMSTYPYTLEATASFTVSIPANAVNAKLKYIATGYDFEVIVDSVSGQKSTNIDSVSEAQLTPGNHGITVRAFYRSWEEDGDSYNSWGAFTLDNIELTYETKSWQNENLIQYKDIYTNYSLTTDIDSLNEIPYVLNGNAERKTSGGVGNSKSLYAKQTGAYSSSMGTVTFNINLPTDAVNPKIDFYINGESDINIGGTTTRIGSGNRSYSLPSNSSSVVFSTFYNPNYSFDYNTSFILDNIVVTYSKVSKIPDKGTVNYNNTSYDNDHTKLNEFGRTLNALPDKGIVEQEWKYINLSETTPTWKSGKLDIVNLNNLYQLSLRVKDMEGAWSEPYIITLGEEINNPPVAKFVIDKTVMNQGEVNAITDLSTDPDNDTIGHWSWRLFDQADNLIQDFGEIKPNLSTISGGDYQLRLKVQDDPRVPPAMWSEDFGVNFTISKRDAVITSDIPTEIEAGKTYTWHVTAKNTGNVTWSSDKNYRLGTDLSNFPGQPGRFYLPSGVNVAPGQSYTWEFTYTAANPGLNSLIYTHNFRMLQEMVVWFGETHTRNTNVINRDAIITSDIPEKINANQDYTFHVTARNTGNVTWNEANKYRLGTDGSNYPGQPGRYVLPAGVSVAPGQSYTWEIKYKSGIPGPLGLIYTSNFKMLQEMVTWFGETHTKLTEVIYPLQLNASLSPNPCKQGGKLTFNINTIGNAEYLTIYFPTEIYSLDNTTPIQKAIVNEYNHTESINYYLPLATPLTIDDDGNRLRTPYLIDVRADRADGIFKIVTLELDVKGNIFNGLKTQIK